jgi:Glycosyltransferase family 87
VSTRIVPSPSRPPQALAADTLLLAARRAMSIVLFGAVPIAFATLAVYEESKLGLLGFDFKGTIWHPGREILAGHSPYPLPVASELNTGNPSVYPPFALLLCLPFALLPLGASYWFWVAALVVAVLATLRILGIRDWRCYAIALGSCPVAFGLALGNIVILLLPFMAYAWRHREKASSGLALGLAIALKLVLWPLLVWLLALRRGRAAVLAVGGAAVVTLAAWAVIGFNGFRDYPRLLSVNDNVYGAHSWSLVAGGVGIGLPLSAARLLAAVLGLGLLALALVLARRPDGDRRAFTLAVVASIALLPVVWPASLAVLIVPLALAASSADRVWLLLAGLWIAAAVPRVLSHPVARPQGVPALVWRMQHSPPPTAQIAVFALLVAMMTVAFMRLSRRKT